MNSEIDTTVNSIGTLDIGPNEDKPKIEDDSPALVLRVFWRYVNLMRSLQFTYWLEPAGSHGGSLNVYFIKFFDLYVLQILVWGLDDYHFLPFLFGSVQLRDHKYLKPKSIHDKDIIDEFSADYMYFACIKFINSVLIILIFIT